MSLSQHQRLSCSLLGHNQTAKTAINDRWRDLRLRGCWIPVIALIAPVAYLCGAMGKPETITKLNHSQELFLLLIVEQELAPYDAYRKAYPRCKVESIPAACSRLLNNVKLLTRKAELEAARALVVRASTRVTADMLSRQLQEIADAAMKSKQLAAASQAVLGIAKLHGFLVDKHQVDAIVRRPSSDPLSPDMMTENQWLQAFNPTLTIEHTRDDVLQPEAEEPQDDVPTSNG